MENGKIEQFKAALAATILAERKSRGLSHEKLAEKAKITRQAISTIESGEGNPTVVSLLKIADALGIRTSELIMKIEKHKR